MVSSWDWLWKGERGYFRKWMVVVWMKSYHDNGCFCVGVSRERK